VNCNTDASPAPARSAMPDKLRRRSAVTALFAAAIALLLALPSFASASPLGEFEKCNGLRFPAWVFNVVTGPEGNVWFVDGRTFAGTNAIGKVTPSCEVTEYEYEEEGGELHEEANLVSITVGPEGKLWVTDRGLEPGLVVIDPAEPEEAKEYSVGINGGSQPQGIVVGPDGNIWFADAGSTRAIGKVNPSTHVIEEECPLPNEESKPRGIVAGADGNLWFTDTGEPKAIGKIDPNTCEVEEFPTGESSIPGGSTSDSGPWGIVAGADGNVWFTGGGEEGSPTIGRITPSGTITEYGAGLAETSRTLGLTAAADGKLWFTDNDGVNEEQAIEFTGSWANGNQFQLCNSAKSQCETASYSTEEETLAANVEAALESIYGGGNFSFVECFGSPLTCYITFRNELFSTNVGQTSCEVKTGSGSCAGATLAEGVPNAVGSITYSGTIARYPIDGLRSVAQLTESGGSIWFPIGRLPAKIGKFGIESGSNLRDLTITKSPNPAAGTGVGSVQSKPKGVKCGTTCDEAVARMYKNTPVVLTAKPATGSTFVKWVGGPCNGKTETTCTMPMEDDEEVEAVFGGSSKAFSPAEALTLGKEGSGKGTVKASGLACEADCSSTVSLYQGPTTKPGKIVVLKQAPAFGSEFSGWDGCDSEPEGNCQVAMESAQEVTAEYTALPNKALTINKAYAKGNGSVSSKPKGIKCGTTCTQAVASMPEGAEVVLTAKPSTGTFVKWVGGDCNGKTETTCTATMNTDETIEAVFSEPGKAIAEAKTLTLNKAGKGFGTVKASGLACEVLCTSTSALYQGPTAKPGKIVVLKAVSAPGSEAVAWSGCDSVTEAGECVVEMDGDHAVTAKFDELE
jgi:streptogramin lyase